MSWRRRAYPLLFAIFPIIGVSAKNAGDARMMDMMALVLLVATFVAIVYLALFWLIRSTATRSASSSERSADMAAFVLFCAVAVFYLYSYVAPWIQNGIAYVRANPRMGSAVTVMIVAPFVLVLASCRRWWHRRPGLDSVGRFLSLTGVLAVCSASAQIVYTHIADARAIRSSSLIRELDAPIPMRDPHMAVGRAADSHGKHDVYIILLDEYPSSAVLREQFGIDNTPFEDTLRAIGFRVPPSIRSNYSVTLMSVASLLNFAQTQPIEQAAGRNSHDFTLVGYLLEHNRAERFLKTQGYRFAYFPSSWFGPTQSNSDADYQFDLGHHWDINWILQTSSVFQEFSRSTMFSKLLRYFPTEMTVHTDDMSRTFAALSDIPPSRQPTFVFAHILAPHPPFIEDANCDPLPRDTQLQWGSLPAGRVALRGELACLNGEVLRMVRTVISRSKTPPIIILQGDHGSQSLGIFRSTSALPTVEQARERFRPFGAYYLPDGGGAAIPDSISMVNVLRYVFNYYFNTDLRPLPNTMYYSHWMYPYRLTEVDSNFRVVRH